MKRKDAGYCLLTVAIIICLIFLGSKTDLLKENYSHLETGVSGYFAVLFLGILFFIHIYLSVLRISDRKNAFFSALPFLTACILPSALQPSSLLANLHLILAYCSTGLSILFTVKNLYFSSKKRKMIVFFLFGLLLCAGVYAYSIHLSVNTLSELFYCAGILLCDLYFYF